MLPIMDRIKKIILVISDWMEFIEIGIQMRQDFRRKGIISGFVPFSMKPDLYACSIADDIFQLHIYQFFNPTACFISMDAHSVLIYQAMRRQIQAVQVSDIQVSDLSSP